MQIEGFVQPAPGVREEAFEHPAHRENSGACIDRMVGASLPAQAAAGGCGTLQHPHVHACAREVDGGAEATYPCTYNDCSLRAHGASRSTIRS